MDSDRPISNLLSSGGHALGLWHPCMVFVAGGACLVLGCSPDIGNSAPPEKASSADASVLPVAVSHQPDSAAPPAGDQEILIGDNPGTLSGLHNVMRLSPTIWSGGEPEGTAGFDSLSSLGITTIVSVDGAIPDVEKAAAAGMRYVHIPIGYDGIPEEARLAFVRVARESDGAVYVHCHHGKHRGPAAAAMICQAAGAADKAQAAAIMTRAGTSHDYAGLWRDVAAFTMPDVSVRLPELTPTAPVDSLAHTMADIDRSYDDLMRCQQSKWKTPESSPDLVPLQTAVLVLEGFREAGRHLSDDHDDAFRDELAQAEQTAQSLVDALRNDGPEIDQRFTALKAACDHCHAEWRNGN